MDQILGARRSVPRTFYPLADCPAERREHSIGKVLGSMVRSATKHGFIAHAHVATLAQWAACGKGSFIPMPKGRVFGL
jgi:hypothetical protein